MSNKSKNDAAICSQLLKVKAVRPTGFASGVPRNLNLADSRAVAIAARRADLNMLQVKVTKAAVSKSN
jgi:hypothetical protein